MNTRTTLVLAVLAALVAGYWFFSEYQARHPVAAAKKPDIAKLLYDPKPKDVDNIVLVGRGGKEKMVFKKQTDNSWQMIEPIQTPATEFEVNALNDRLGEIKYVKTYDKSDKDRPSDAVSGMDKPNAAIKVYAGEKLLADVMIGNKVPTGVGTYIRTGDSDTIYQANTDLVATFNKRLDSFRNRNVVKFELKDVKRVKVEGSQNYELSQNNGTWVVEAPTRGRGDKEQIEKIVRPISTLYVQDWKDDQPITLRPYQLDKPRLKLTIETSKEIPAKAKPGDANTKPADTQPSTETKSYVLLVGGATDPSATSYFAKLESAPWVFSMAENTVKDLSTNVSELRDKQVITKADNAGDVTRIEATTPGGEMKLTKNEKGEWAFADGMSADSAAVDDLVKTVQNMRIAGFADKLETLVSHDWNHPRARITLTRRGAANSTTLLVGEPSASGQMVYVKNVAEDSMGAVSKADADPLLAPPVAYRDRTVLRFPRDQANKLEITRAGSEQVVLTKAADRWSMVEPVHAAADADSVRNVVADVSSLRAKKVVATGDKAKYGLDKPQVKLTVYTEVPAPRPPATAPAHHPTASHPASVPAMLAAPSPATHPAAAMKPRPAAGPAKSPQEQIKQLEELLHYQTTTLRQEGKENPKATEMLQQRLAELKAQVATQPAIKGAPQGADEPSASTQPVVTTSAPAVVMAPPAPEVKIYHLSITQQNGVTYVSRDDLPLVYELENKIFEDATAEMRDRQVLKFDVANVSELGFDHGDAQVVLRKSGEDWKYALDLLVPIDGQKVTEVLNVFRDLKTHRYEAYANADLSKYGLDKDVERVWVVLKGGTSERQEVVLSKSGPVNDKDKSRYAMLSDGKKAVFQLKGDQATKFQQKLEDFRKSAAAAPAPGAVPPAPPTGSVE